MQINSVNNVNFKGFFNFEGISKKPFDEINEIDEIKGERNLPAIGTYISPHQIQNSKEIFLKELEKMSDDLKEVTLEGIQKGTGKEVWLQLIENKESDFGYDINLYTNEKDFAKMKELAVPIELFIETDSVKEAAKIATEYMFENISGYTIN